MSTGSLSCTLSETRMTTSSMDMLDVNGAGWR